MFKILLLIPVLSLSIFATAYASENELTPQYFEMLPNELISEVLFKDFTLSELGQIIRLNKRFYNSVSSSLKFGIEADFSSVDASTSDLKKAFTGPSILNYANFVNLTGKSVTDDLLSLLSLQMRSLILSRPQSYLFHLESVERFSNLNNLDLSSNLLNDVKLRSLLNLKFLKKLNLNNNNISGVGLTNLSRMTKLAELHLSHNQLGVEGFKILSGFKQLRKLDLSRNYLTNEGLQQLVQLPDLRILDVSFNPVKEDDFEILLMLPSLEHLTVGGGFINSKALASISKLNHLKTLAVTYAFVHKDDALALGNLKQLEELRLTSSSVDEDAKAVLQDHLRETKLLY